MFFRKRHVDLGVVCCDALKHKCSCDWCCPDKTSHSGIAIPGSSLTRKGELVSISKPRYISSIFGFA